MKARETAVILATGGMGLVRAAYSAGKPAYGVGPGNAPAYIERTADVMKAVRDIVTGKTFDNGVLCSSENSVVCDAPIAEEVKRRVRRQRRLLPVGRRDRTRVAQRARHAAAAAESEAGRQAGDRHRRSRRASPCRPRRACSSPSSTGVGRDYPLSIEKLCPVLSFYVVQGLAGGLRALQADPAVRRHGPHDVDPLAERRRHPASSA